MANGLPNPLWTAVLARAEAQWSILRRSDLRELGVHRAQVHRWVTQQRLHWLHPGIWTVGHRLLPRRAEFLAATWWCGGDAALADESACAFYAWTREDTDHPPPIHVTTPKDRKSIPGIVVHRTRRLPRDDVLTFERLLRVTDEARTLIDRADRLAYRELRLLADRPRRLPVAALRRKHAGLPGRAGWRRTELLIGSEDARARSVLERRFTAYAERYGIRSPDERNAPVAGCELDCVWHDPRVALELDSRAHHQRRAEMLADKARDRRYRRAGYLPIRVMWEELELDDPAVARELIALVGGRDARSRR